jgi:hypothetical protein
MPVTVKSTAASEFVAASVASDTAVVCGKLLVDFGYSGHLVPVLVVKQATTYILVNAMDNNATKYSATPWHCVRELVGLGIIHIHWLPTKSNVADMFTKPLQKGNSLFARGKCWLCLPQDRACLHVPGRLCRDDEIDLSLYTCRLSCLGHAWFECIWVFP